MSLKSGSKKIVSSLKSESNVSKEEYSAAKTLQSDYVNNFGSFLIERVIFENPGNVFISPLSVHTVLMMVGSGAVESTLEALQDVLQMKGLSEDYSFENIAKVLHNYEKEHKPPFIVANSLWIDSKFSTNEEFLKTCDDCFGGVAEVVPFSSKSTVTRINKWISTNTKGLISKVFDRLDEDKKMILVNTVYFKDSFSIPFKKYNTHDSAFNLFSGKKRVCQMMKMTEKLLYYVADDAAFVSLGFKRGGVRMLLMLPAEEGAAALTACTLKYLRASHLKEIEHHLTYVRMELKLPRFEIEFSASLKWALLQMGLVDCFGDDAKFAKISSEQLKISDIIHKTVLKVDENGVEAAAATAAVMRAKSRERTVETLISFVADRPFMVVLYDSFSTEIFSGVVKSV
ncbi:putative peptidase inhibitor [Monocercomonoides exilis]|uniref:putative peptidase inhibitor n=1 Tax=Monocercomonoides exilis TaxID=2049356 RepID=UPI00355A419E|nr:putative peptidase inhibitor [Monocercomonoides exilis]|eukprot:MONOS_5973.1-p1 / transcript=MONOS_5973.1 / gene=MONOS_5973 / organism=Monocercomonoides_exilis_PA203 / gene_product=peptidase inhibitor / transcript_product=peptidase inhibitor / location=Mono_scaffold00181:75009-76453(+) / protein_length=399 / sequence_SO=supercontig / SO=protein_coding / is_pseudo=false